MWQEEVCLRIDQINHSLLLGTEPDFIINCEICISSAWNEEGRPRQFFSLFQSDANLRLRSCLLAYFSSPYGCCLAANYSALVILLHLEISTTLANNLSLFVCFVLLEDSDPSWVTLRQSAGPCYCLSKACSSKDVLLLQFGSPLLIGQEIGKSHPRLIQSFFICNNRCFI